MSGCKHKFTAVLDDAPAPPDVQQRTRCCVGEALLPFVNSDADTHSQFLVNLPNQSASLCGLCSSLSKNGEVAVLVADGTQLVQEVQLNLLPVPLLKPLFTLYARGMALLCNDQDFHFAVRTLA